MKSISIEDKQKYPAFTVSKSIYKEQIKAISTLGFNDRSNSIQTWLKTQEVVAANAQMHLLKHAHFTNFKYLAAHPSITPRTIRKLISYNSYFITRSLCENKNVPKELMQDLLEVTMDEYHITALLTNPNFSKDMRLKYYEEHANYKASIHNVIRRFPEHAISIDDEEFWIIADAVGGFKYPVNEIYGYAQTGSNFNSSLVKLTALPAKAFKKVLEEGTVNDFATLVRRKVQLSKEIIDKFLDLKDDQLNSALIYYQKLHESAVKRLARPTHVDSMYHFFNLARGYREFLTLDDAMFVLDNIKTIPNGSSGASLNFLEFFDPPLEYIISCARKEHGRFAQQMVLNHSGLTAELLEEIYVADKSLSDDYNFLRNKNLSPSLQCLLSFDSVKNTKTLFDNEAVKVTEDFSYQSIKAYTKITEWMVKNQNNLVICVEMIESLSQEFSEDYLEAFSNWEGSLKELKDTLRTI